jgi:protein-tyrosine-phosphatase
MLRVLVLCTGNSARSQMAEGLLRHLGKGGVEAFSAGTRPRDAVHPVAVLVMAEQGLDISAQRPKDVEQLIGQRFDYVITVCDRAKESCPVIPGAEMLHWSFPDPAEAPPEEQHAVFRDVLAGLRRHVDSFLTTRRAQ